MTQVCVQYSISKLFFSGLGYATQVIVILMSSYYIVVLAWAILYLSNCFTWDLPWTSCNNTWNTGGTQDQHISLQTPVFSSCANFPPDLQPKPFAMYNLETSLKAQNPTESIFFSLYFTQDSCRAFQQENGSIYRHENATSPVIEFWE